MDFPQLTVGVGVKLRMEAALGAENARTITGVWAIVGGTRGVTVSPGLKLVTELPVGAVKSRLWVLSTPE